MARVASTFKWTMCALFSVPLANWVAFWSVADKHEVPRYPVCPLALWTGSSFWRLVWMKETTIARADRNHKEHGGVKAPGPPRCQWGRLERQDRPEWLLAINRFNKNGLCWATLRPFQSILSVSPACGLLRIRMAWFFSVKATQMEMKTAEIFKAALLRLVAQSYPLCDPLDWSPPGSSAYLCYFPIVVPIIRRARTFYVFQRRGN